MYIGDGKLSPDQHHLDFTSKDPDMVKFMLNFFKSRLNLKTKDIRYSLTYKELDKNSTQRWSNYLDVPSSKINLKQSNRHGYDCLGMQIGGIILRNLLGKLVNEILETDFCELPQVSLCAQPVASGSCSIA